jgi:hypothetical protein
MSFIEALLDGVTIQYRIYLKAVRFSERDRRKILLEGILCVALMVSAVGLIHLCDTDDHGKLDHSANHVVHPA